MGISLTLFNSVFDNKTNKRMDLTDWEQFVDLLFQLSKVKREGKRDAQLMSPAIYKPDTTRANVNVDSWAGWAAVDIDDFIIEGDLKNELTSLINALNVDKHVKLLPNMARSDLKSFFES